MTAFPVGGEHAARLLAALAQGTPVSPPRDPVRGWADCGAMALTGRADGPPLVHTGPAVAVQAALDALGALAPGAALPGLELLGERAAVAGLQRGGAGSCGGGTRLLPCADGWVALTLSRPTDLDLVPALVEGAVDDPWDAVGRWLLPTSGRDARERGRLLGLALTVLGEVPPPADLLPWRTTDVRSGAPVTTPVRVVDLSSLWAGPLAASLLRLLGAEVIAVEDPGRPDGLRRGSPAFHALLRAGVRPVSLALSSPAGRADLHRLLLSADVVLEGSRPRALQQLGLPPERLLEDTDLTWVSITAHGRDQGDRGGYGDDTAAAGGLVCWEDGAPRFVADAVGDPLTGVHAALLGWAGALTGGARLVDLAMSRTAAVAAALGGPAGAAARTAKGWRLPHEGDLLDVRPPRTRNTAACC